MLVTIDFSKIEKWDDFHSTFSEKIGFPSYYGNNMNAWIDCMSYLDTTDSRITLSPCESLEIEILNSEYAIKNCTKIFQTFIECTAFVNKRYLESDLNNRIKITFL